MSTVTQEPIHPPVFAVALSKAPESKVVEVEVEAEEAKGVFGQTVSNLNSLRRNMSRSHRKSAGSISSGSWSPVEVSAPFRFSILLLSGACIVTSPRTASALGPCDVALINVSWFHLPPSHAGCVLILHTNTTSDLHWAYASETCFSHLFGFFLSLPHPLLPSTSLSRFSTTTSNHVDDTEPQELHPAWETGPRCSITPRSTHYASRTSPCPATSRWSHRSPSTSARTRSLRHKRPKCLRAQAITSQCSPR